MATTLPQARKLLTAAELDVFVASRGEPLKALSAVQLRGKVKRARTLRDKFQDLHRRQTVAARARRDARAPADGAANERTRLKAQIFAEALERFEQRLARLERAAARAAPKSLTESVRQALRSKQQAQAERSAPVRARSRKAPADGPANAEALGPESEGARVVRHAMQPKVAGQTQVHAHVSSQGRRNQARRDRRG